MPVKISPKTYTLDLEIASLQFKTKVDVDDKILRIIHHEIEELYKALTEMIGEAPTAIAIPPYRRSIQRESVDVNSRTKLIEYANTHTDFTIKGASEDLNLSEKTLWAQATKLVTDDLLERMSVAGGIAHIYRLKKKIIIPIKQTEKIAVLPNGKQPFPPIGNPEREKMQALRS